MLAFSRIDDNFTVYRENRIVIFGAGCTGRAVYSDLENICPKIICFCDNDKSKHGTELYSKTIISLDSLKDIY